MLKRLSIPLAGLTAKSRKANGSFPTLWVMTDEARLPDPTDVIRQLPANSAVIIRHTNPLARRALAASVLSLCKAHRVMLLIADDWRAAASVGCDGIHLPETSVGRMAPGLRLWRKSKRAVVTAAAHTARAVRRARAADCDIAIVSPVLPTRSHPNRAALGRVRYAMIANTARLPVVALGGIDHSTLRSLNGTRTGGVAGISFAVKKRA